MYVDMRVYIYTGTWQCSCAPVCVSVHLHRHRNICAYAHVHAHVHAHVLALAYTHTCAYAWSYMRAHAHENKRERICTLVCAVFCAIVCDGAVLFGSTAAIMWLLLLWSVVVGCGCYFCCWLVVCVRAIVCCGDWHALRHGSFCVLSAILSVCS